VALPRQDRDPSEATHRAMRYSPWFSGRPNPED
jgi:hypothetical protein